MPWVSAPSTSSGDSGTSWYAASSKGQQPDLPTVSMRDNQFMVLGYGGQVVTREPDVFALIFRGHRLSPAK